MDQVHALVALLPGIEQCVPIEHEAGWPPEPVWAFWNKKKKLFMLPEIELSVVHSTELFVN